MSDPVEPILKSNRRVGWVLVILASLPLWLGLVLLGVWGERWGTILTFVGVLLVIFGLAMTVRQLAWLRRPRVALSSDFVRLFVGRGCQYDIPLDVVECFFLGQALSQVRVSGIASRSVGNVTVVVRLAQRAKPWHERPADARLAKWEGGYVTLYGDWCEPITGDFVNKMNHQLADRKRSRKG